MPGITHRVTYVALYDFVRDYMERGAQAIEDCESRNEGHPFVGAARSRGVDGEDTARFQELEAKCFPH